MSSQFQSLQDPATGRVRTFDSATRPAGAIDFRGMVIDAANAAVVTIADTGQNRVFNCGLAQDASSGSLLTSSGPAANIASGGLAVSAAGALVTLNGAPSVIHQGVGLSNAGALCIVPTSNPELIINGSFDTDVSGWLNYNATLSWVASYFGQNGVLRMQDAGAWTSAYQEFSTEIGQVYDAECMAYATVGVAYLYIQNASEPLGGAAGLLLSRQTSSAGSWQQLGGQFTAAETTTRLRLFTNGTDEAHYDDVSVKKN